MSRSRRLDETYVRVKGAWQYLYRAVDFLLTSRRACKAALRFLRKAIGRHGVGTSWRSTTADVIKIPRALEALEARANP